MNNRGAVGTKKVKLIIDCDPGGDDAAALILLLRRPDKFEILALTITNGNTCVKQAMINALRILKLTDRLDVPVYGGSKVSITGQPIKYDNYFGCDAFGDFVDDTIFDYTPYLHNEEHSVQAMQRLVKHHPNEIILIAIAPLTNLAFLLKKDPNFGEKLKGTFIMGGNYRGVGNVRPTAEFNFFCDPEAANDVMTKWKGKINLITWELCLDSYLPWKWAEENILGRCNKYSVFLKNVHNKVKLQSVKDEKFIPCDQLVAAILVDGSIVKQCQFVECHVECADECRRGENVVNWQTANSIKNKTLNICLITQVDTCRLQSILSDSVMG